jgi:hypothetical protein
MVARTLGGADRHYFARRVSGGFLFANRAQGPAVRFSRRGAVVRSAGLYEHPAGCHMTLTSIRLEP